MSATYNGKPEGKKKTSKDWRVSVWFHLKVFTHPCVHLICDSSGKRLDCIEICIKADCRWDAWCHNLETVYSSNLFIINMSDVETKYT